jgi:hypothetical protein
MEYHNEIVSDHEYFSRSFDATPIRRARRRNGPTGTIVEKPSSLGTFVVPPARASGVPDWVCRGGSQAVRSSNRATRFIAELSAARRPIGCTDR